MKQLGSLRQVLFENEIAMNLRIGIDLINIERFSDAYKRHGDRLLKRIFTEREIEENDGKIESLAVRFAAKEAVSKALGTGIGVITWHEVEIIRGNAREPILMLHGQANVIANELGLTTWAISLTHTRELAAAFVAGSESNSR
jgi:holo-[acyl-carrier protein] synthase